MTTYKTLWTLLLIGAAISAGCSKPDQAVKSNAQITVTGGSQEAEPGKEFKDPIIFEVRDRNKTPLAGVQIATTSLSDPQLSSHLPGYEVLTTDSTGRATARAVAGNMGGFETRFRTALVKDPAVAVEFTLKVIGMPSGGGAASGEIAGDDPNIP